MYESKNISKSWPIWLGQRTWHNNVSNDSRAHSSKISFGVRRLGANVNWES